MGRRDRPGGLVRRARRPCGRSRGCRTRAGGRCRAALGRVPASRPVEIVCGAIGIFLFALTIYAGFEGTQSTTANWTPDLHLRDLLAGVRAAGDPVRRRLPRVQPVAGDRPGGRVDRADGLARRAAGAARIPRLAGPLAGRRRDLRLRDDRAGLRGRATSRRTSPSRRSSTRRSRSSGWRSTASSAGWTAARRSRSTSTSSRGSPCSRRATASSGSASRCPGCLSCRPLAGTVPLLMVMIGTVSFDGFTNKRTWNSRSPDIAQFFQDHLSLSPRALARAGVPARLARDGPVHLGLLLARHPGRAERGRRLQRQGARGPVRAHAGADRGGVRRRALLHAAALPGPGDGLPGLRSARGRVEHLRHRRVAGALRPDWVERGVVCEGGDDRLWPRGRPDPGA